MTFLIYIILVRIYCEIIGSYADFEMFVKIGIGTWFVHNIQKMVNKR